MNTLRITISIGKIGATEKADQPYVKVTFRGKTGWLYGNDERKVPTEPDPGTGASGNVEKTAVAPKLTGINTSNVKASYGLYSMDLGLKFNGDIYMKPAAGTGELAAAKLPASATFKAVGGTTSTVSLAPSGSGDSYTLSLKDLGLGTITLPSQTFYDKTGKESTTGPITIKIGTVTNNNNETSTGITTPQVTVSFGNSTYTKDLK